MAVVKTKKLTKSLNGTAIVRGVDLEISKGEVFGIIGPSGAGKSTLVRLLVGLESPTQGSIEVKGRVGMIFQHFNLFSHLTALGNVCFANPDREEGMRLLDLVGLKGMERLYPAQLSGGQKQRVAIARALACKPKILFCDEATSSLDPETTSLILDLLVKLNEQLGLTIVLITHEMEVIKSICHRMAVLELGQIIECGDVVSLLAHPKHATTKRLLETLHHQTAFEAKGELLRLFFKGDLVEKPILSTITRCSNADLNILLGGIDRLRDETVGSLLVELSGSVEEREKARSLLREHGVDLEEIR